MMGSFVIILFIFLGGYVGAIVYLFIKVILNKVLTRIDGSKSFVTKKSLKETFQPNERGVKTKKNQIKNTTSRSFVFETRGPIFRRFHGMP